MKYPLTTTNVISAASLLGAMSTDRRLYIMSRLTKGEVTACQLADEIKISQPALSQHLSRLRKLGLVRTRRVAKIIYYRCDDVAVKRLLDVVSETCRPTEFQHGPACDGKT